MPHLDPVFQILDPISESDVELWVVSDGRTYLGFPWRPLIDVTGGTTHTLDERGEKVRRGRGRGEYSVGGV